MRKMYGAVCTNYTDDGRELHLRPNGGLTSLSPQQPSGEYAIFDSPVEAIKAAQERGGLIDGEYKAVELL